MVKLHLQDIVVEPLVSEKGTALAGSGKYVFKVHVDANKPMVKEALEKSYTVKVKDINILNQKGKRKKTRARNVVTYTKKWKKAIVSLRDGEFPFFETLK
jgi:large subunit ribosomal protein L23